MENRSTAPLCRPPVVEGLSSDGYLKLREKKINKKKISIFGLFGPSELLGI